MAQRTTNPPQPADDVPADDVPADDVPADDVPDDDVPADDVVLDTVLARFVGIEPVLAIIDGASVLIQPGDPIPVTVEQLEQNPIFQVWED